jgi:hypothetical protein
MGRVTLGVQRGFPKIGDESFPGAQNFNNQITKFISEGGKVYACRVVLPAVRHGEPSLIEGSTNQPARRARRLLLHRRDNAFILDTWTLPTPLRRGQRLGPLFKRRRDGKEAKGARCGRCRSCRI